jgi:hypothetical protein
MQFLLWDFDLREKIKWQKLLDQRKWCEISHETNLMMMQTILVS